MMLTEEYQAFVSEIIEQEPVPEDDDECEGSDEGGDKRDRDLMYMAEEDLGEILD